MTIKVASTWKLSSPELGGRRGQEGRSFFYFEHSCARQKPQCLLCISSLIFTTTVPSGYKDGDFIPPVQPQRLETPIPLPHPSHIENTLDPQSLYISTSHFLWNLAEDTVPLYPLNNRCCFSSNIFHILGQNVSLVEFSMPLLDDFFLLPPS